MEISGIKIPHSQKGPEPGKVLLDLFSSAIICESITTALVAGVIPLLREHPTLDEIHARLGLHNASIKASLDLFQALGWLTRNGERFVPAPDSPLALLMADSDMGEHWRYQFQRVLGDLQKSQSVVFRSGNAAKFPNRPEKPIAKMSFFTDRPQMESFSRFSSAAAKLGGEELAQRMDFAEVKTVVDLGGNDGSFLLPILEAHTHLHGTIVDLPSVTRLAEEKINRSNLRERCVFRGLDFFYDPLPKADIYMSGFVLHDWPDAYSEILLKRMAEAIKPGGLLILHESLLDHPDPEKRVVLAMLHFHMVLLGETGLGAAGEKASHEYVRWLKPYGFAFENVIWRVNKSFLVFRRI